MSKMTSIAATVIIAANLFGHAANAHPRFQSADPTPEAAMTTASKQIRITFNENPIAKPPASR